MRKEEKKEFMALMLQISEMCEGNTRPSKEKLNGYFLALSDMKLKDIAANGWAYVNTAKPCFFPVIADLRGMEQDPEIAAIEAYEIIKNEVEIYGHYANMGAVQEIIKKRLAKKGKGHLIPHAVKWLPEIAGGEKPGVVRAQFIKSYSANNKLEKHRALTGRTENKQLTGMINKLLKGENDG